MKVCELIEWLKKSDPLNEVIIVGGNSNIEKWWGVHSVYKNNGTFIVISKKPQHIIKRKELTL